MKLLAYRFLDNFKTKTSDSKPDDKSGSQSEATAARKLEAKIEPKPVAKADSTSMLDKTLREVLLAGIVIDPEDAGLVIAAAIMQPGSPAADTPAADTKDKSAPDGNTETDPDAGGEKPSSPT